MLKKTEEIIHSNIDFLPLKTNANIITANALQIDWNSVVSSEKLNYIMGNPPFVGARLFTESQRNDMNLVFGKLKGVGNLDYVSCWYKKCAEYIKETKISCALVSTNSITQGEQVSILWKNLIEAYNIEIDFAYRTFKWNSEASEKAKVHCVIIGFSAYKKDKQKIIFLDENAKIKATHINPYLIDAENIFIENRTKPLCDVPKIHKGCQPTDGGNLIIEAEDYENFIKKEPKAEKYIKKLIGAREFLQNKDRYCLWLVNISPSELKSMPFVLERVKKCKEMRLLAKDKATQKLADRPTEFRETYNYDNFLVVPMLNSENRKYIPIGFYNKETISTNLNLIIECKDISHFGILQSNVHIAWVKMVCGRMGDQVRYSAGIVYNNFPFPKLDEKQRDAITQTAKKILEIREKYKDSSLADLYNDLTMPVDLRNAHRENDKAVINAYGWDWKGLTETQCVEKLMKLYKEIVK